MAVQSETKFFGTFNLLRKSFAWRAAWRDVFLDFAAVAIVAHVAAVLAAPLTYSEISYDESFYVYGGYGVLHGQIPYRHFQNLKGPLVSLSEALAVAIFGIQNQQYRLFHTLMAVTSIAVVVAALIQRRVTRLLAIAIGLLICGIYFNTGYHDSALADAESLVVGYFLYGLACLLVRPQNPAAFWFFGGFFLAATTLVKENFLFVSAVTWFAFLVQPRAAPGQRRAYAMWSLSGGLCLGLIITAYLALNGGLMPYVRVIMAYRGYAGSYCVRLGRFHLGTFWSEREQEWRHISFHLFNMGRAGPWALLFIASLASIRRNNVAFVISSMLAVAASLVTISIGHCYWPHYFTLAATGFTLFAVPGADAISRRVPHGLARFLLGVVAVAGIAVTLWPKYKLERTLNHPPYVRKYPPAHVAATEKYSNPGDFILTLGTPDFYFALGRLGAHETNGFVDELLDMYPGTTDTERVSGMRARLEETRPKVVIFDSDWHNAPGRSQRTYNALVRPYLTDHHYVAISDDIYVRPDVHAAKNGEAR